MQNTAQPLLALKMTGSPFLLSLISALQFTPVLLFSLFAGVIVDRLKKKNILIATQIVMMLTTFALAILYATGNIQYWHLIVSATMLGFANAFDMPARQSFVIELVGPSDLSKGIALNSAQFNLARIVGPALAGLVMAQWGIGACFFINAISFGAVIAGLIFVKPRLIEKIPMPTKNVFINIGAGMRFIFTRYTLFMPLLFITVAATFAMNTNVLVPVFAEKVLKLDELGYGLLMASGGVGALIGALAMAMVSKKGIRKAFIYQFPILVAVIIVFIGISGVFALTAILLAVSSFFFMIFMASVNTTMQLGATDEFRGRVMSVYTLVVAGSTPLGNLFAGAIADRYGAGMSFVVCGLVIIGLLVPMYFLRLRFEKKLSESAQSSAQAGD